MNVKDGLTSTVWQGVGKNFCGKIGVKPEREGGRLDEATIPALIPLITMKSCAPNAIN